MIGALRAIPNFARFGTTWASVKLSIIQFLQEALGKSDAEKIVVTNRVARMVSEMDLTLISNQVAAAAGAPAEFEGQMEEEMLGVDLTAPLPFELTGARTTSLVGQLQASGIAENIDHNDAALFNRTTYGNEHIGVDSVGELAPSPELQQMIAGRTGGDGTVEFGNSDDSSRTVHGILSEMVPAGGEGEGETEGTTEGEPHAVAPPTPAGPGAAPHAPMSHEEETEIRLQEMMAQSDAQMNSQPCTSPQEGAAGGGESRGPEGAASAYPEAAKFGPLTRGQRARYTLHQMGSGMGKWWQCNRGWLIPTIIGVIIVAVVALVLSGGTVSGAIGPILSALGPIMIGVAALRASYYIGEYIYKSVNGDIPGASKSLARGFAVAAVEGIFALLGSASFWKSIRNGISGAAGAVRTAGGAIRSGVRAVGRGVSRVASGVGHLGARMLSTTAGGRYLLRTGGALISRGRLILNGIRGRIGQGIRSLEELAERLFSRVRFRRFRITFRNGWFRLEGYINPWVLMATGNVQWVQGDAKVGTHFGGGVVVGSRPDPSRLVRALMGDSDAARRLFSLTAHPNLVGHTENLINGLRNFEGHVPGRLSSVLSTVENMASRNIQGLETLLRDLASGRNQTRGAAFVLSFLDHNPSMLASLSHLELSVSSGQRVIDAVINGMHFEFKNWPEFIPTSFIRQTRRDLQMGVHFRWIFSERILQSAGSVDELLATIRTTLRNSGDAYFLGDVGTRRISRFIDRVFIFSESTGRYL
jgi:hypothetical protein